MKTQRVGATEFKAKCLALIDKVNEQGGSITITKRGKPVAVLQPVAKKALRSPAGMLAGEIEIAGDIVNFNLGDSWNIVRERFRDDANARKPTRRKES